MNEIKHFVYISSSWGIDMSIYKRILTVCIFIALSMSYTQNAFAFKINLTDTTLNLDDGMSSTTATIVNDSTNMIAIEAGVKLRSYNRDGVENFDIDAEDLIMIPSQMIVPPGGEQVLSIRWTGPRDVSIEKSYRLLIEYVAISEDKLKGIVTEEQQAGININYRIAKAFYVSPKGAKAKVTLQNATRTLIEEKDLLQLSFENIGNKHQIAHGIELKFVTTEKENITLFLSKADLGGSINFLPQETRDIIIPCPDILQEKEIMSATIVHLEK